MKILYLDASMGAAGDMLTSALMGLMEDKQEYINKLNCMGLHGVTFLTSEVERCGIKATLTDVDIYGEVEGEEHFLQQEDKHHHEHDHHEHEHDHHEHEHDHHEHEHDHHEHEHHHEHHTMDEIEHTVEHLMVSPTVKKQVLEIYKIIAQAESKVHGQPISQVHLHEVGAIDAIADVAAVCLAIELLQPEQIVVSPVNVGFGKVKCAHGILPVPAPATAEIINGMPVFAGEIEGEMCTPTGAALLKYFATYFGKMPAMSIERTGYGAGHKNFKAAPNVVRAILGSSDALTQDKAVIELNCNVDDMTGEEIGFATETLLEQGALDVSVQPIYMKKNRPGFLIRVICTVEMKETMVELMFKHTTTIGIRETVCSRYVLSRTEEKRLTALGEVRLKVSSGFGTKKEKLEYEDLKRITKDCN